LLQNETNLTDYIISSAYDHGVPVAFNVSPLDGKALGCPIEKVKYIIVNELEGKALVGGETYREILANLSRKYPDSDIVMTVGKCGVLYWSREQSLSVKAAPVEDKIRDTTAAGDTFLGYYLASILQKRGVKEALVRASAASALAIQREGAAPSIPLAGEVDQEIIDLGPCENW
jgi:Sugar kinases, ribokinase family